MAWKRIVLEIGMGTDIRGTDPTKAAVRALRDGRLVRLLPQVTPVPDTVYSIFPPRRHPGANVSRLVAHLQATFAGTPPWERDLP